MIVHWYYFLLSTLFYFHHNLMHSKESTPPLICIPSTIILWFRRLTNPSCFLDSTPSRTLWLSWKTLKTAEPSTWLAQLTRQLCSPTAQRLWSLKKSLMPSSFRPRKNGGTSPRPSKASTVSRNSTATTNCSNPPSPGKWITPSEVLSSRPSSTHGSSLSTGSRVPYILSEILYLSFYLLAFPTIINNNNNNKHNNEGINFFFVMKLNSNWRIRLGN